MTVARSTLWQCPKCRRRFAKRSQWHSCSSRSVDVHFQDKDPRLRRLFEELIRSLARTGPLRFDAVKTSINLISTHHFGGVRVREDHLRLGFLATAPIKDARILRSLRIGPRRVHHAIILCSRADLDAKVLAWLRAAQALQAKDSRGPASEPGLLPARGRGK